MRRQAVMLLAMILGASAANADVIHFKNGDRLTGELERVQDNNIVVKTGTIGEARIPVDKLEGYSSSTSTVVLTKSG